MSVPPDWPLEIPCRMAFVGEAPSDEELMGMRPMIGPAGRLWNKLLRVAQIERPEHLVTNVFDEKLPGNEVANWCATTKEMKAEGWREHGYMLPPIRKGSTNWWLRPEHEHHLTRLHEELEAAQPTVVVPLGGTALWAINGTTAIMAHRGTISEAKMTFARYKVVPTLHPSFLFHSWKLFATVVADLMKADRESHFPEIRLPNRELWVDPTLDDLREFYERFLAGAEEIAIDLETIPKWRHVTCISFAPDPHLAIAIPFVDWRQTDRSYWRSVDDEVMAVNMVRGICESPIPKILQNGTYDAQWLWWTWRIRLMNYRDDTRLMHHALYPELPKALGFMGSRYAEIGPWKTMRRGKGEKVDD